MSYKTETIKKTEATNRDPITDAPGAHTSAQALALHLVARPLQWVPPPLWVPLPVR